MDQLEKQMFDVVDRNHRRRRIMDKIDKDLQFIRLANRLNKISARRKKK